MSKKKILIFSASLLSLFGLVLGLRAATSYRAVINTPITVNEQGTCAVVTNAGSYDIFVPTNTSNEWSLFRTNKPAYVTLGACGPTIISNYATGLSCNTICANNGKTCSSVGLDGGATDTGWIWDPTNICGNYGVFYGATCADVTGPIIGCGQEGDATQCRCN